LQQLAKLAGQLLVTKLNSETQSEEAYQICEHKYRAKSLLNSFIHLLHMPHGSKIAECSTT